LTSTQDEKRRFTFTQPFESLRDHLPRAHFREVLPARTLPFDCRHVVVIGPTRRPLQPERPTGVAERRFVVLRININIPVPARPGVSQRHVVPLVVGGGGQYRRVRSVLRIHQEPWLADMPVAKGMANLVGEYRLNRTVRLAP
jgi:hypothetical protein